MESIKLNFLPVVEQSYKFLIYRKAVENGSTQKEEGFYRTKLPVSEDCEAWALYDVSFEPAQNCEEMECRYSLNGTLSEEYLYRKVRNFLKEADSIYNYKIPENSKYKEFIFTIENKKTGSVEVIVHPYFLPTSKKIGFLFQHQFNLNQDSRFDRNVQIDSLSLDSNGKPNVFMYRDKESIIHKFVNDFFMRFCSENGFEIESEFHKLTAKELDKKMYMVGGGQISQSQFMGIKNHGPYRRIYEKVGYLFLFSERTRSLGRDVYLGLIGKLFPGQFSGLQAMFGLEINKDIVDHYPIHSFEASQLEEFSDFLDAYKKRNIGQKTILIVILPKGYKGKPDSYDAYGFLKFLSLKSEIYCQFVTEDTFYKKDLLKWSISNIALQIFGKLGGAPWLVKPAKSDCLIMGLGSAHAKVDGRIVKWFAYTVCLDSSGDFKFVKPLSSSNDISDYLNEFKKNLREIFFSEASSSYKTFVLHIPFKIKRDEIDAIKETLASLGAEREIDVVVIRINTMHKFLGFSDHNTRVPYEGSVIKLSSSMYLVWPEGLEHGKEVLHKRISEPLLIDFIEQPKNHDDKDKYIQDIFNLAGANWRGFNSKARPISILYSKLIADFMKDFSHLNEVKDLQIVKAESSAPWFL
ncbi:Piwi domain-containing protein [Cellvibrio sp. NN19]|uniref:Piwi domain-containing protein n=1 Tax=Cellvibrio chitinivorans TaxID=3102792 RepID=UPI002B41867C|nr:Piwi domain-containing protein [Cellvibrio sp. NN19]